MELWDLYDQDRNPLGETMVRGEEMKPGTYHIVIHVCIFNSKGEMLIQQRQPFKHGWPNLWDLTVGGSAIAGENSQRAAEREVMEEIGLKIDLSQSRPGLTIHFDHGFDDNYFLNQEVDLSQLVLQPEEVKAVQWASREKIHAMIDEGTFIPYYKSKINFLFDMKDQAGAYWNWTGQDEDPS